MDIKRKESKLVISNQSSVIKTPKKKRLVLGFRKWFSTPSPVLGESLPAGRQGLGRGKEKPSLSPSTSTSPPEGEKVYLLCIFRKFVQISASYWRSCAASIAATTEQHGFSLRGVRSRLDAKVSIPAQRDR